VPRNGYINRLQAWASASILANILATPLEVAWESETIAPAEPSELFSEKQDGARFIAIQQVNTLLGIAHDQLPRYLQISPDNTLITLAGHDRGEQVFMNDLLTKIQGSREIQTLIIIAGGKFHLGNENTFQAARRDFYRRITWSQGIQQKVDEALENRSHFSGLHIRGTDHSLTAPSKQAMTQALARMTQQADTQDLFITADTGNTLNEWSEIAESLHLRPWSIQHASYDRTQTHAGVAALIDWNILRHSKGIVYSKISSFAEEASVASDFNEISRALSSSQTRQQVRKVRMFAESVMSYPRRHHWF